MPEVELGGRARQGYKWGWMERSYAEPPIARRWVATDVACSACQASAGEACSGPRVCPERLAMALEMARSGQLPVAPPDQKAVPSSCAECGSSGTTRGGLAKACGDPLHRCQKRFPTGHTCTAAVVPGTRYCPAHPLVPARWNGTL
jgi:hypothetical protein